MFLKIDFMKIRNKDSSISLTGGLGNQLFQLAAGLFVSKKETLTLEWGLGRPRLNHLGLPEIESFSLPNEVKIGRTPKKSIFASKFFGYALRQGIKPRFYERLFGFVFVTKILTSLVISIYLEKLTLVQASNGVGFSKLPNSGEGKLLIGYFQSYKWMNDPEIYKIMRGIKIKEYNSKINYFCELAKIENPLVVHIRLGDYKNEILFGIPTPDYYKFAIQRLLKSGNYGKVWVFSDEPETAMKTFNAAIPFDARWIFNEGESAAQTLEIMRYGKGYVIANSTFSWWGAFLSYTDNPIVIAPNPWFRFLDNPQDLIPLNWNMMPGWHDK